MLLCSCPDGLCIMIKDLRSEQYASRNGEYLNNESRRLYFSFMKMTSQ